MIRYPFLRRGALCRKPFDRSTYKQPGRLCPPPHTKRTGEALDRRDAGRLFQLLEQLYQGKKKPRDEVTAAIWAEVLKPWSYEQVRDAAIRRARENRYMPDPSELAAYLPRAETDRPASEKRADPPTPCEVRSMERLERWREEWHRELREQGLPTLHEALEAGMTPGQWRQLLLSRSHQKKSSKEQGGCMD